MLTLLMLRGVYTGQTSLIESVILNTKAVV